MGTLIAVVFVLVMVVAMPPVLDAIDKYRYERRRKKHVRSD